jgi:hypothetical protein
MILYRRPAWIDLLLDHALMAPGERSRLESHAPFAPPTIIDRRRHVARGMRPCASPSAATGRRTTSLKATAWTHGSIGRPVLYHWEIKIIHKWILSDFSFDESSWSPASR